MAIDADKLQEFLGRFVSDLGATAAAANVVIGHRLGLYRALADEPAGVADRVSFEVASAASFSGSGYDLAATFDCLHDMGDPLAAAKHVRQALKPDGTWLVVEPYAADETAGNMNPVGRVYYSFSTLLSSSPAPATRRGARARMAAFRSALTSSGQRYQADSERVAARPRWPGGYSVRSVRS